MIAQWHSHDLFTIRMVGSCEFVRKCITTLEEDFTNPNYEENDEQR